MAQALLFLKLLVLTLPFTSALKFDLAAHTGHNNKYERCIRNFVAKDTLVLVTAIVGGSKGDGQQVNMHVCLQIYMHLWPYIAATADIRTLQISDAVGNEYGKPKDLAGETRMAFTSHADAAFDVCFENQLVGHRKLHHSRAPPNAHANAVALRRGCNEPAPPY